MRRHADVWFRYLCLVTVIKHDEAKDKKGLIDYNCHIFQDALAEVFARGWEKPQTNGASDIDKALTQAHLEDQME